MSETFSMSKDRLATLPTRERAKLAQFFIGSLGPESEVEDAWEAELARRASEIRAGKVEGRTADRVFAELRARFPRRRSASIRRPSLCKTATRLK